MQRTISAMTGKGSVNHNSRKLEAQNADGSYCLRFRAYLLFISGSPVWDLRLFIFQ